MHLFSTNSSVDMDLDNGLCQIVTGGKWKEFLTVSNKKDLRKFSMIFKQDRINRGYTNTKLAMALLRMYDKKKGMNLPCLQQRISRFESNDMSFKAMRKFQPMLAKWPTDLC